MSATFAMPMPPKVASALAAVVAGYADTSLSALVAQLDYVAAPLRDSTLVAVAIDLLNERRVLAGVVWYARNTSLKHKSKTIQV
jgi:hypothetical protein